MFFFQKKNDIIITNKEKVVNLHLAQEQTQLFVAVNKCFCCRQIQKRGCRIAAPEKYGNVLCAYDQADSAVNAGIVSKACSLDGDLAAGFEGEFLIVTYQRVEQDVTGTGDTAT